MRTIRFLHRWLGGLIGLLLAVLGLSGTLLLYEDAWLRAALPHAAETQRNDTASVAAALDRLFGAAEAPTSIILSTATAGVHRVSFGREAGAYADQTGALVARWSSQWERWELWVFDLHHHLFAGDTGETVAGIAALAGLGFVVTGAILWWPSRRTFRPRVWPRNMGRGAIVAHHRDVGTLLAPLLAMSLLTGAMMTLPPVRAFLLSPFSSSAEMDAASAPPGVRGGARSRDLDWPAILGGARDRFPGAELRIVSMPRKDGDLIRIRLRQPWEWLPNGRTMVWVDPADGRIVESRDAGAAPLGSRVFSFVYPVHAAKVGGAIYTAAMTLCGLALTALGSLAVYSFWLAKLGRLRRPHRRSAAAAP
ncbi:MAG: PepSY-associated TM helix domain-containing protein [Sphingomonadales bacterium]